MRVLVVGGTGMIGSRLVRRLDAMGADARAASPTLGVNTITRIGLAEALQGVDVVVDVADAPSYESGAAHDYFEVATNHLLRASATAGVRHIVALSVVGADRLAGSGYMDAKLMQEAQLRAGGLPSTIVRSTHTFEFMRTIPDATTRGDVTRVCDTLVQPLSADDLAAALADAALDGHSGGTREVGGPERMELADLVARTLEAAHDRRRVVIDPTVPYFDTLLDRDTLLPGPGALATATTFDTWSAAALAR